MEGLYFALCVFGIAIVIRWCLIAERAADGEYRGLLAMRRPAPLAKQSQRPRRDRLRGSRRK
jgi:hypothetical protein